MDQSLRGCTENEGVEIAQGIGGTTKVMSRPGMISFCYFLKDIQ